MSGVWIFPPDGPFQQLPKTPTGRRRELVYLPTGQVVNSYSCLEQILTELGWKRYDGGHPDLFQFHKPPSNDLISLPREFSRFKSVHMYDIVVKNPNVFHVRES